MAGPTRKLLAIEGVGGDSRFSEGSGRFCDRIKGAQTDEVERRNACMFMNASMLVLTECTKWAEWIVLVLPIVVRDYAKVEELFAESGKGLGKF